MTEDRLDEAGGQAPVGTFSRVAVIGCGLVGGSFALASRRLPDIDEVVVFDKDPAARLAAQQGGLHAVDSLQTAVVGADLIVLAVPVEAIVAVARETGRWISTQAIVTDVGSVKGKIVSHMMEEVPELARRFVGGHPMAGSERHGFAGAQADLFEGATYVLTPVASTATAALDAVGAHVRRLGARVLTVDPDKHDRLVAVVSHLPQVVSSSLMRYAVDAAAIDPGLLHMAGGGFRDVTRVAGSDPELWVGILRENRETVGAVLGSFVDGIEEFRRAIEAREWGRVEALLGDARDGRELLPQKRTPGPVVDLVVPVPDEPGNLATVTTALGEAGVNIEDVSMRHVEEGGRGVLVVAVSDDDAETARVVLAERGLSSHIERR